MNKMLLVVAMGLGMVGCKNDAPRAVPAAADRAGEVSIDEFAASIASGACTPVDANGEPTRKKFGVIPGAVLLTDYETYTAAELPSDKSKQLVFYCANEQCGASHKAAQKAIVAGYTNVRVLPAGVLGWKNAGKQLQTL